MSLHQTAPTTPASGTGRTTILGGALIALFLANLLNFFDRAIPAVVAEPIKIEFGLSDLQLGLITSAFTVVYAIAGLPLGRLADRAHRPKIIGAGLLVWSGLTAATGAAGNYLLFILARLGVGVGEASFTPAANSMIGDLYPADRRSRALGIFMLGLPMGLMLAYFTVGKIAESFDSWRAPFFVAAVPGVLLALVMFRMRDPERGGAEEVSATASEPVTQPIRKLLTIPTLRWLILAGLTFNFAAYAVNSFTVPLLMRQYELKLTSAAVVTGVIVGLTGLLGLLIGARYADRASATSPRARLMIGVVTSAVAAPLTALALMQNGGSVFLFTLLFALGWLLAYGFYISVYPAIHDIVVPRLRATATALFFAAMYLLGGFAGPVVVGGISDWFAERAAADAGVQEVTAFAGEGLNSALYLVPLTLALTAVFIYLATRTVGADSARMRASLTD
ncbi:MFS transporter [Rhodococcus triatomae]|uniref:Predicted arabinose efflux permease, MFS family n=1 Tax=Rhodococcus triatomae TaxID=300028 RepID=A0A1G8M5H8_9NOCA|nr:MFS transporter [Rhodococcus triatomae]QNG18188.1 MFS transporter [Rhodococcus triatomae]QNG22142.1 MFS transporter [Rhodococcus triatomae]SDI63198.1 Predicted arabinose efflux permease, MFS family [Rhodococcus triatomae]